MSAQWQSAEAVTDTACVRNAWAPSKPWKKECETMLKGIINTLQNGLVLPMLESDKWTNCASLDAMSGQVHHQPADEFRKMSWQTVSSPPTELKFLSDLHKDGWLLGLVRPSNSTPAQTQGDSPAGQTKDDMAADQTQADTIPDRMQVDAVQETVPTDAAPGATMPEQTQAAHVASEERAEGTSYHCADLDEVGLVKEVLHLSSVGQPLGQCGTTGHLIKALYNFIEAHDHIYELDVLHRNISCGHAVYFVLLADWDHSIKVPEEPQLSGTAGTSMFIAIEMSAPRPIRFKDHHVLRMKTFLAQVETNHAVEFARAFPNGDGDFMGNFQRIMDAEGERMEASRNFSSPPSLKTRHARRHDVESIYWVFTWAFARARPIDSSPGDDIIDELGAFCKAMLSHAIGGPLGEAERKKFLLPPGACDDLFHPDLRPLETLFNSIAAYLSIPWYRYCGETAIQPVMPENHAHIAVRRIILGFALDPENADALRIDLDTEVPRHSSALEDWNSGARMTTTKYTLPDALGNGSKRTRVGPGAQGSSRKAVAAAQPASYRKRKSSQMATERDDVNCDNDDECDTNAEDGAVGQPLTDADAPPKDECTDGPAMQYVAEHEFAITTNALVEGPLAVVRAGINLNTEPIYSL
ncbi:hypothetical protein AURDEDRAFT_180970 [Auricularia subglabra TFB-10046 SS5]|nr:hypothetical protein AURDEDRAFT_180970 [Auricularia subglabra TFB-10046 SS5]